MSTLPQEPILGVLRRTPEDGAVRPFATLRDTACKQCGNRRFERIPRYGFWQETILPFFNRYPWRCVGCAAVMYRTQRSVAHAGVYTRANDRR